MGSLTKLLDKPLKAFTVYAFVVLLCSIPVYFLIIDFIWVHEINEHNEIVAVSIKRNLTAQNLDESKMKTSIELWNSLQPETKIRAVDKLRDDSTYNIYRKDIYSNEGGYDRFQSLVTYFKINNKPYNLTVEANVEESYETIFAITAITVMFFIILLLGFIRLNKRISQKLWQPFYQTLEKIKAFDLSNYKMIEFEPGSIAEFEELNAGIGRLLESNITIFRQQKEFTENASHELQTPLAIVQSKLDLLLQDEKITSAQSQIIEETNNALFRVSRINKNLLLLAKIENQQFLEKEQINMSELLQDILDLLSGLLEERIMECDISPVCIVEGNKTLVEIMLTNLLMNSLRHTDINVKIALFLSPERLIISNPGSYSLEVSRLYRRFGAASAQTPGSGLGLSIVKEICDRYNWIVEYKFVEQRHVFTVWFGAYSVH